MTQSWMQIVVRTAVLGVALAAGLHTPAVHADDVSDVNGDAEAPAIRGVIDCLSLCTQANALVAALGDKEKLDDGTSAAVLAQVEEARTGVAVARGLVDAAQGVQPSTDADFAHDSLGSADARLAKLVKKLAKPLKGKVVRKLLAGCRNELLAAKMSLQGIFVEGKDALDALQATQPLAAYCENFDRGSMRSVIKQLRPSSAAAKGVDTRAAPKKVRRAAAAGLMTLQADGAKISTSKRKGSPSASAKAGKQPADYYLSFAAESPKQTEAGSARVELGREIRGRFFLRATLGLMDTKRRDPTSQAEACLRLEIVGSSPPDYLEVCARPTETGVQVGGTTTGGVPLKTKDFPDVSVVDIQLEYDGFNFFIYARPEATPPGLYVIAESHFRPIRGDAWTLSLGASGLTGKATVGIDRVVVRPR